MTHEQKVAYLTKHGWGFTIREGRYAWTDPKDPTRATCETARAVSRQLGRDAAARIQAEKASER